MELKKCPFCGAIYDLAIPDGVNIMTECAGEAVGVRVWCECGAIGPWREDVTQAAAAWNRRASDEAVKKAREALSEIVSWTHDTQTCANEDAMWKRAAKALAALKEA